MGYHRHDMTFDPECDLPPDGAEARFEHGAVIVRFDANNGWWIVVSGPVTRIGSIAYPFSPEGLTMAREYAQNPKLSKVRYVNKYKVTEFHVRMASIGARLSALKRTELSMFKVGQVTEDLQFLMDTVEQLRAAISEDGSGSGNSHIPLRTETANFRNSADGCPTCGDWGEWTDSNGDVGTCPNTEFHGG